ncbi:hypothetical protein M2271_005116 [Streptomyces sp. LBL]|uniref:hypothetical protein n=1 Tax=Streptomyces sp. LBL TaxID=2940562 RepID=UPI002476FE35|nr:hypothetical protein [Streptomyces sp. LBL]MDH6627292.1 hypothetical protein [Streptomyces sp. LBL]
MSRKGRGAEINRSGWPESGPKREWLEYCDRLHKANNFRSLRTLAAAMGYSSPSWVSQLLRGPKLPYDDTQAQSLVKALGAEGSEVDHALKLYRRALRDGRQRHVAVRRDCVGRLISELGDEDAVAFGVHPSVQASTDPSVGNAPLPGYLTRRHDKALRADIARAEHGSRVVVLVGQSSTGKSRACWEAMRSMLPDWFVWHPLAPTRPTAVLEALEGNRLRPRTVIWLDEMQLFLAAPTVGEQVATRLHELVQDQSRGPLLVLGSMWPRYIDQISREPAWDHAAARLLLRIARIINVPQDFTGWDLTALRERLRAEPDATLRLAVARAGTRVCQFLAGVPHLMARYEQADATTQAVVWAAMDARRLGHGRLIPEDFLLRAARSYLTADTWEQADADWFQHALSTLAEPCLGVPGPLVDASDGSGVGPHYRLTDYLDQLGRIERADQYPRASFWDAAVASIADPADLTALAQSAWTRGRLQQAERLFRAAADLGGRNVLMELASTVLRRESGKDQRLAERLYQVAADHGEPDAFAHLAHMAVEAERPEEAEVLYRQAAKRGSAHGLEHRADERLQSGDQAAAASLYQLAADRGSTHAMKQLAQISREAGDLDGEERLLRAIADRGYSGELGELAVRRDEDGDPQGAERLLDEAAPPIYWRRRIADARMAAGDRKGAERVLLAAVGTSDVVSALHNLAELRKESDDRAGAERAYEQAMDLGDPFAALNVAVLREEAGHDDEAVHLLEDIAAHGDAHTTGHHAAVAALRRLVGLRCRLGDHDAAYRAACSLADRGDPVELAAMGWQRDRAGDREGALRLFRVTVDRGYNDAFFGLMTVAMRSGDHELAARVRRESEHRGLTHWLMDTAVQLARSGDRHATAVELFRRAADGGNAFARRYLSSYVDNPVDGVDVMDHRLHPAAGHSDTAEVVSQVWFREIVGDRAGADAAAGEAAECGNHLGLINLAWLRADAGDTDAADRLLWQAVDRGNVFALERLADARVQAGDRSTAIALYRRAAADGYTFAWQMLARLYEAIDDLSAAHEAARQGAILGDADALTELARSREAAGDVTGAKQLVRQAVDCGGSDALQALYWLVKSTDGPEVAEQLRTLGLDDDGTFAAPSAHGPRRTKAAGW